MDFIRKQQRLAFQARIKAWDEKAHKARKLLGLTKPSVSPQVIAVDKQPNFPAVNWNRKQRKAIRKGLPIAKGPAFLPKRKAQSSFPGRWSSPDGDWRKSAFSSGWGFEDRLEKRGWKKLGAGAFSSVWARSETSTKVLKVTRRPDNWIEYIQWAAKEGYLGRFAPMVYSFKRVKGVKHDFLLSVVERMDKVIHSVERAHDARLTSTLFSTYGYSKNIMAGVFLDEMAPGLAAFTEGLHKQFGRYLDLHEGNIMVRADGSFVVTDPVADWNRPVTVTRLKAKDLTFAGYLIKCLERFDNVIGKCYKSTLFKERPRYVANAS